MECDVVLNVQITAVDLALHPVAQALDALDVLVGSVQRCLVVGEAKKGEGKLSARTDNNRIVTFNGPENLIGQMVNLKINEVYPHTLGGELV